MLLVRKLLLPLLILPWAFPPVKVMVSSHRPGYHLHAHGSPAVSASQSWYHTQWHLLLQKVGSYMWWLLDLLTQTWLQGKLSVTKEQQTNIQTKSHVSCQNFCFKLYSTLKLIFLESPISRQESPKMKYAWTSHIETYLKCFLKLHKIILPINTSLSCLIPRETLELQEGTQLNATIPFRSIPVPPSSSHISRAGLLPWVLLLLSLLLCICKTWIKLSCGSRQQSEDTELFLKPEKGEKCSCLETWVTLSSLSREWKWGWLTHPLARNSLYLVVLVTHSQSSQDSFFTYA